MVFKTFRPFFPTIEKTASFYAPYLTYAASFGMTAIPDGMFELYRKGINRFESLLLREKEGLEMCKALGRNDAKVVLDPTLLLGYDDYREIMDDGESPMIEGKYIL